MKRLLVLSAIAYLVLTFIPAETPENRVRGSHSGGVDVPEFQLTSQDFLDQWSFQQVKRDAAHGMATGVDEIIAVFDVGFDFGHSAVDPNRVLYQYDYVDRDGNVAETQDSIDNDNADGADSMKHHGTGSLSIAMELAPDADFLLYRVLDEEGVGDPDDLWVAINDAVNRGATILSLSLTLDSHLGVHIAIQNAIDSDVTVVAASGNDGSTTCSWPASMPGVIAVASVDDNDDLVASANNGPDVDILAPGFDVVLGLAFSADDHGYGVGTSYSVPFVAAAVALLRDDNPGIELEDILDALQDGAADIGLTPAEIAAGKCGLRLDMEEALLAP